MEDEDVMKTFIHGLSKQAEAMKPTLKAKSDSLQLKMEAENKKLQGNLDATKKQIVSVQREMPAKTFPTFPETLPIGITPSMNAWYLGKLSERHYDFPDASFLHELPVRKQLIALPKFDVNPCDWLVFNAEYS